MLSCLELSLRPLLFFLSLIGIDLRPTEKRPCTTHWPILYTFIWIVSNIVSNIAFLVLDYEQVKSAMPPFSFQIFRYFFMFITFAVQVIASHLSLVYMAWFDWPQLHESLLNMESVIVPGNNFYSCLKKFAYLAVVIILSVKYADLNSSKSKY